MAKKENPSAEPIMGQPKSSFEMTNKYGTYNIQPTNDSENEFPEIAQGLAKSERDKKLPRSAVRKIQNDDIV